MRLRIYDACPGCHQPVTGHLILPCTCSGCRLCPAAGYDEVYTGAESPCALFTCYVEGAGINADP